MAEDGLTKFSFEFWLHKTLKWGQSTTPESQQDVCLHLPELQEFLLQIYGALKHMNCTTAVQQFPLLGQLLGRLCWNPLVIAYDECQKILMWCLCCLYSGEPQNPVELKANSWIQSSLCHLLSISGLGSHDTGINSFISALGFTSADYHSKLLENVVLSLVTEISRNRSNRFKNQKSISSQITSMSLFCVPLITLPDVTPLVEALLSYHDDGSQEVLSSAFLEAVNEAMLQKQISLSEPAVLQLWLRHLPSLEKAVLQTFENLISIQPCSMQEMAYLIKDSLLDRAICHPAVFRTIDEILKNALLETDGAPEVMSVMQVFTQCFVQAYHNNNKQHKFPLKAYFPHNPHMLVMALLKHPKEMSAEGLRQHLNHIAEILKTTVEATGTRSCSNLFENWFLFIHFGEWVDIAAEQLVLSQYESTDALLWLLVFYYEPNYENQQRSQTMIEARSVCDHLTTLSRTASISATELQTAVSSRTGIRQPGIKHVVRHLIISFLLFTPGGQVIAREFIDGFAVGSSEISEVIDLLAHLSNRVSQAGMKYQRTITLVNDLLQKLKSDLKFLQ
ncbi:Fanconi anemia group C protein [Sceloporus undulatus]|uniref:Fanconi anemia group C protein n=1 Tax=Sceloporus undulatus TaxID=8520 RepID=UPI001C4C387B|nr:Fanconi anemia group C protein [Sceloporus undulatus]XP_042309645.1 Fanconi anemia group C protein [Sceloporus undulatus]